MEHNTATYENPDVCTRCGGKCCTSFPGSCSPEDVLRLGESDDLKQALLEVLGTSLYVIDWWKGDPRDGHDDLDLAYFVRPRRITGDNRVFSPAWSHGPCTFFIPGSGCPLPARDRPLGCRLLEPQDGGNCIVHGASKHDVVMMWLPYNDIVKDAGEIIARLE